MYDCMSSDITKCVGKGGVLEWPTLQCAMSLASCVNYSALIPLSDCLGVTHLAGILSCDILRSLALLVTS